MEAGQGERPAPATEQTDGSHLGMRSGIRLLHYAVVFGDGDIPVQIDDDRAVWPIAGAGGELGLGHCHAVKRSTCASTKPWLHVRSQVAERLRMH
jgi:hypothetical protein